MSALTSALALAREGAHVFPCLDTKAPACPGGFKAATADPAALAELWRRYPGPLIGIATGNMSGLSVLDLYAKHRAARDWWGEHRTRLPRTRTIRTRSGGLHLWFLHAPGLRCSVAKIGPGIDVRADRGYAIAWDAAGLPVLLDTPPAPWPEWLDAPTPHRPQRAPEQPRVPDDEQARRLLRFVRGGTEGERNNRLFWAACRMAAMVNSRLMTEGDAERLLLPAALETGLPEAASRATIASAFATGRA